MLLYVALHFTSGVLFFVILPPTVVLCVGLDFTDDALSFFPFLSFLGVGVLTIGDVGGDSGFLSDDPDDADGGGDDSPSESSFASSVSASVSFSVSASVSPSASSGQ
jgi:hypothetical protein